MKQKNVLLAGATGLVGSQLLELLLRDESIAFVYAFTRRALNIEHPKLISLVGDFEHLPTLPPIDEVYLALGTTIKTAGTKEAFYRVDFTYTLAIAKAALEAGAQKIGVISSLGASPYSKTFYNRVKGDVEVALELLHPQGLIIVRPSLLLGNRKALNQGLRVMERLSMCLFKFLKPLLPHAIRAIEAEKVAKALYSEVPHAEGIHIIESAQLHAY